MIRYTENPKYTLSQSVSFETEIYPDVDVSSGCIALDRSGNLFIKQGFGWNGANVALDKNMIVGSLVHDALYDLIKNGYLAQTWRKEADKLLIKLCRQRGMSWLRSRYIYAGVFLGGWFYT